MSTSSYSSGCDSCKRFNFASRRAELLYYLNAALFGSSIVGIALSIAALSVLEETEDYGILGFAKWAPFALSILAFIFALVMMFKDFETQALLIKILYAITMGLMILCILMSGIVFILYATNSEDAAYSDSRTVAFGSAAELRIQANDRAMALWNTCCASIYAENNYSEVKSCSSPDPCLGQSELCACYQNQELYNSLIPQLSDCVYLSSYKVVVLSEGQELVVPLVGENMSSCAGGDPKLFQQYLNELLRRQTVTLGAVFLGVGLIISLALVCYIDTIVALPSNVNGAEQHSGDAKLHNIPPAKPQSSETPGLDLKGQALALS